MPINIPAVLESPEYHDWWTNLPDLTRRRLADAPMRDRVVAYYGSIAFANQPTVDENLRAAQHEGVEQLQGDDLRLAAFWAEAARLAKLHDWCDEYDMMAIMMKGPRRTDVRI